MKINCIKEKILETISKAEKFSGKNLSLSSLNKIVLKTHKDKLVVKSTNLDIGIELSVPVKVEKEGEVSVSGSILQNVLSNIFDDNQVTLNFDEKTGNLSVSSSKTKSDIKAETPKDFPDLPKITDGVCFSIEASKFFNGLKNVFYSASLSSIKPELSSVYVYLNESNNLVFAATDSFRLAEKEVSVSKEIGLESVLIPYKNVPEIIKIIEQEGVVDVCLDKNQINFSSENLFLTSRVVDGVFPDYKQVIPKDPSTEVVLLKQDLIDALKMIVIFSDKFNKVSFCVDKSKKTFSIESKNTDVGQNKVTLDATIEGEPININYNHKYLVDCFQSIPSDSVVLRFHGQGKPVIIQGVSDSSFTYLVMPMNK